MSYTVKTTGSMSFKNVDLQCPKCEYEEERSIDLRGIETEDGRNREMIIMCPNCEHPEMDRIWKKAPSIKMGNDRSDAGIARMKNSFRDRFVKKEIDDVRHKYGRLYDDSVGSAAAQRIGKSVKKGK